MPEGWAHNPSGNRNQKGWARSSNSLTYLATFPWTGKHAVLHDHLENNGIIYLIFPLLQQPYRVTSFLEYVTSELVKTLYTW